MRAYLKVQFPSVPWTKLLEKCEAWKQRILTVLGVAEIFPVRAIAMVSQVHMSQSLKGVTLKRLATLSSKNVFS